MNNGPMDALSRRDRELWLEEVRLAELAERFGTPTYAYSARAMREAYRAYLTALGARPAMVCYAVKANSNLGVLSLFAGLGAGFDIVSGGELARVLAAGGDPSRVLFSGVGKRRDEIAAALEAGICCFNVESAGELARIAEVARSLGTSAPIAFRVNPDVDPKTHPYISTGLRSNKFGVAFDEALELYREATRLEGIRVRGIACHIGSQLLDPAPAAEAAEKLLGLVDRLEAIGIGLEHIDLGGGLGIRYEDEQAPAVADYLAPLLSRFEGRKQTLCLEPGRSLVGNAGVLLTRVEFLKHGAEKNFAIVDAAMNDLARPALYDAYHAVVAVHERAAPRQRFEIVGPICESGDFLARERDLALAPGDLLAILSAGAYGMTMSSNYNTRPRAAEVIVSGREVFVARRREQIEELFAHESPLPRRA